MEAFYILVGNSVQDILIEGGHTVGPVFGVEFDEFQWILVFHPVMHRGEGYNHFIWCQITNILESDDIDFVVDFRV